MHASGWRAQERHPALAQHAGLPPAAPPAPRQPLTVPEALALSAVRRLLRARRQQRRPLQLPRSCLVAHQLPAVLVLLRTLRVAGPWAAQAAAAVVWADAVRRPSGGIAAGQVGRVCGCVRLALISTAAAGARLLRRRLCDSLLLCCCNILIVLPAQPLLRRRRRLLCIHPFCRRSLWLLLLLLLPSGTRRRSRRGAVPSLPRRGAPHRLRPLLLQLCRQHLRSSKLAEQRPLCHMMACQGAGGQTGGCGAGQQQGRRFSGPCTGNGGAGQPLAVGATRWCTASLTWYSCTSSGCSSSAIHSRERSSCGQAGGARGRGRLRPATQRGRQRRSCAEAAPAPACKQARRRRYRPLALASRGTSAAHAWRALPHLRRVLIQLERHLHIHRRVLLLQQQRLQALLLDARLQLLQEGRARRGGARRQEWRARRGGARRQEWRAGERARRGATAGAAGG